MPPIPPAVPPPYIAGDLVLEDFVNVTNAASAALGQLLVENRETVETAATAAATSSVAAKAGASAVGSVSGPGGPASAGKALTNAQRLQCYSKLAGPPEDGDDGGGGGWTSGRLGLAAGASASRRRRLATSTGGGTSSSVTTTNAKDDPVADMLADGMLDTLLTVLLFMSCAVAAHYAVLLCWHFLVNRKYYRRQEPSLSRLGTNAGGGWPFTRWLPSPRIAPKSTSTSQAAPPRKAEAKRSCICLPVRNTRPKFRSLPAVLRFPMLEKLIFTTFAPALLTASCSVVGGHTTLGGGHTLPQWSLVLSIIVIVLVVGFHAMELRTLMRFRRLHHVACWQGAEEPQSNAEVDDPCLALLGRLRLVRPTLRGRGGYEPPEEDCAEPARTERALSRALCCNFWRYCGGQRERAGDVLETMPMWLDDANVNKGVFFIFVQTGLQLTIAALTGVVYAHPWLTTEAGGMTINVLLIALQVLMVVWVSMNTANDLFTQLDAWFGFTCELVATCIVFSSNLYADSANGDESQLLYSLRLAGVAAQLLVWTAFVPMFLTACILTRTQNLALPWLVMPLSSSLLLLL